ncbi:PREDICTED: protein shisa-5 isoform X1 [Chinchilla lanigera]|nr:PREDICTED: protein shisa-5 isoform X1 [Chinchilla lanigera]
MAAPAPAPRTLWLLLLLVPAPPRARGEVCPAGLGGKSFHKLCPDFCCGSCSNRYCCSDVRKRLVRAEDGCAGPEDRVPTPTEPWEQPGSALRFRSSFDSDPMSGFGATVAIGLTIFVLSVVTIIICFTCSCCCLYKMCRRPRPVVTTTTATTVVHTPYPQPPSAPPSYPGPTYQGYHPMPAQPGVPAAPYPTQYPPPYPAQPMGPPAYHETFTGGAAAPYPASQPPYNPAYMDPPKAGP